MRMDDLTKLQIVIGIITVLAFIALILWANCDSITTDSYTKQEVDVRLNAMSDALEQKISANADDIAALKTTQETTQKELDSLYSNVASALAVVQSGNTEIKATVDSLYQSQGNLDQKLYEIQGKFDHWLDYLSGELDSLRGIVDSLLTDFPVDTTVFIGDSLKVSWKPSASPDVATYRIYVSKIPSMQNPRKLWYGRMREWVGSSMSIDLGVSYIAVTAVDSALNESRPSRAVRVKK